MTKLTDQCLRQKNSFIPIYGYNKSQKNGRKMEKNAPTLSSILSDEERKMERRSRRTGKFNDLYKIIYIKSS